MATNTTNYNLKKPDVLDGVDITISQLADNFDAIDTAMHSNATKKYKWREEGFVPEGYFDMVLQSAVEAGDELIITDTKYGFAWFPIYHYTASGQIITFTEAMPEDMMFDVINLGHEVV